MKKIATAILLILLSSCLFENCVNSNSSRTNSGYIDKIEADTLALLVNTEGHNLIIILTADSIEYGSAFFSVWPKDSILITDSISWIPSRTHYVRNLRPEQITQFNKIKQQMKGWIFDDPGGVKDGMSYHLYRNGRRVVWGHNSYYENFPNEMRESIVSILNMVEIKRPNDEFDEDNWVVRYPEALVP